MDFLSIFVFFYISTFLHLRRAFTLLFALLLVPPLSLSRLQSCRKRKTSIDLENDIRRQDKERLEVKIQ